MAQNYNAIGNRLLYQLLRNKLASPRLIAHQGKESGVTQDWKNRIFLFPTLHSLNSSGNFRKGEVGAFLYRLTLIGK